MQLLQWCNHFDFGVYSCLCVCVSVCERLFADPSGQAWSIHQLYGPLLRTIAAADSHKRVHLVSKVVPSEGVDECWGLGIVEGHLPLREVDEDPDDVEFICKLEWDSSLSLNIVLSFSLLYGPVAAPGTEPEGSFSGSRFASYSHQETWAAFHLHLPVRLPPGKARFCDSSYRHVITSRVIRFWDCVINTAHWAFIWDQQLSVSSIRVNLQRHWGTQDEGLAFIYKLIQILALVCSGQTRIPRSL